MSSQSGGNQTPIGGNTGAAGGLRQVGGRRRKTGEPLDPPPPPIFIPVDSVHGRTGDVVAAASDYDADQVDFTPDGDIAATDVQAAIVEVRNETDTKLSAKANLSHSHLASDIVAGTFADARIAESNVTQHTPAVNHDDLLNYSVDQHRVINDIGTSATELWSASKISTELTGKADTSHTHAAGDITSGTFADGRVAESNVTQHEAAIDHDALTNFSEDEHRTINDGAAGVTNLWSASKITSELAGKSDTTHTHPAADIVSGQFDDARIKATSVTQHEASIDHDALTNFVAAEHHLPMKGTWYDNTTQALSTSYAVMQLDTQLHNTGQFTHDAANEEVDIDETRDLTVNVYAEATKTTTNANCVVTFDIERDSGGGFSLLWRFRLYTRVNGQARSAATAFTYGFTSGDKLRVRAVSSVTNCNLTYLSLSLSD